MKTAEIIKEITSRIENSYKTKEILIFGSFARGDAKADSDIDLIVVLDESGISQNYSEKIERRLRISRLFRDIKKEFPMDILVYTADEWRMLQDEGNSFINEVMSTGLRIA
jgi:predicted nucleotidyltransferase